MKLQKEKKVFDQKISSVIKKKPTNSITSMMEYFSTIKNMADTVFTLAENCKKSMGLLEKLDKLNAMLASPILIKDCELLYSIIKTQDPLFCDIMADAGETQVTSLYKHFNTNLKGLKRKNFAELVDTIMEANRDGIFPDRIKDQYLLGAYFYSNQDKIREYHESLVHKTFPLTK